MTGLLNGSIMSVRKGTLITLVLSLFGFVAKGQTAHEVEKEVLDYFNKRDKWDVGANYNNDSINKINIDVLNYLEGACSNNIPLLKTKLKSLENGWMHVLTSDDNKFRIYCWIDCGGAGVHSWYSIAQYQDAKGTKSKILSDVSEIDEGAVFGSFFSMIYTIRTQANKTIYVVTSGDKIAMGLYKEDIQAFALDNDTLNYNLRVFKTKKEWLNRIWYTYESSLSGDNDPSIKVSADKKKVYIPVVTEDGKVTAKHLVYVFDGNNYVFDKNAK